eukprot:3819166-Rhodomonas_salina.1
MTSSTRYYSTQYNPTTLRRISLRPTPSAVLSSRMLLCGICQHAQLRRIFPYALRNMQYWHTAFAAYAAITLPLPASRRKQKSYNSTEKMGMCVLRDGGMRVCTERR